MTDEILQGKGRQILPCPVQLGELSSPDGGFAIHDGEKRGGHSQVRGDEMEGLLFAPFYVI